MKDATNPTVGGEERHTPAPWFLTPQQRSVVARPTVTLPNGEERWTTKRIASLSYNYNEADARLIAAAPELLEALRQCRLELDWCQRQLAAHGQTGHPGDSVSRALKAGSAAITKATGGTQ